MRIPFPLGTVAIADAVLTPSFLADPTPERWRSVDGFIGFEAENWVHEYLTIGTVTGAISSDLYITNGHFLMEWYIQRGILEAIVAKLNPEAVTTVEGLLGCLILKEYQPGDHFVPVTLSCFNNLCRRPHLQAMDSAYHLIAATAFALYTKEKLELRASSDRGADTYVWSGFKAEYSQSRGLVIDFTYPPLETAWNLVNHFSKIIPEYTTKVSPEKSTQNWFNTTGSLQRFVTEVHIRPEGPWLKTLHREWLRYCNVSATSALFHLIFIRYLNYTEADMDGDDNDYRTLRHRHPAVFASFKKLILNPTTLDASDSPLAWAIGYQLFPMMTGKALQNMPEGLRVIVHGLVGSPLPADMDKYTYWKIVRHGKIVLTDHLEYLVEGMALGVINGIGLLPYCDFQTVRKISCPAFRGTVLEQLLNNGADMAALLSRPSAGRQQGARKRTATPEGSLSLSQKIRREVFVAALLGGACYPEE